MRKVVLFLFLYGISASVWAQNDLTQVLRGTVIDEDTRMPLIGATVVVVGSDPLIGASTDQDGDFRITDVPVGRLQLRVTYIGYEPRLLSNIEVNSAKEVVMDIMMVESPTQMDEIVVKAADSKGEPLNDMALVSVQSVSPEQTSRYAGGFNDPSKITTNFAGVATTPDGGNEVIIRGNSPKYLQWRLEGAEIANPNHFGDQNSVSGIVNALNNMLLTTSDFYTAAFPAEFGDALSGVYDIRMRKGNNEQFEGLFGFGILGTDLTLEGPFKKEYDGSFLVNYRYSTLAMAKDIGIIDMDVNLKFQDAAFKLYLPTKGVGNFSLFGFGGKSGFVFDDADPSVWVAPGDDMIQTEVREEYQKDAHLLNTGVNHTISITPKSYLHSTILYSSEGITDKVYENMDSIGFRRQNLDSDLIKSTYRVNSTYHHKFNAKHKVNIGMRYSIFDQETNQSMLNGEGDRFDLVDFNDQIASLRTFVNWKYKPTRGLSMVAGLHNTHVFFNNKRTLEPRLAVNYNLSKSTKINVGYGNHSKMESVHNYFAKVRQADGAYTTPNLDLGLLRANHYVLGLEQFWGRNIRFKVEGYYQDLYNLPVENDPESSYATLNEGLDLQYVDLVNAGTGKNYGIEFTAEHFLNNGFYALFNTTLYESKYTALDGIERNTQFNANYLINLLAGKEFTQLGKKKNKSFGVNIKTFFGGGRYIVPLQRNENGKVEDNPQAGSVYDHHKAYENKLDDLVNVVFSLSYKWSKKKTAHELYLNIDNLTDNRARLMEYYDANEPGNIGYQRQEGTVPNFVYRLYF